MNKFEFDKGYAHYPQDVPEWPTADFTQGWWAAHDDHEEATYLGHDDDPDESVYGDESEPEMSMQFEHDSAMTSIGWGTDEDYGYYGDDGDY